MPFNSKAVCELRKRANLSQTDLSELLRKYSKSNRYNIKFDKSLISKWENDNEGPRWECLDLLYIVAKDYGHKDLKFYISPTKYKSIKR